MRDDMARVIVERPRLPAPNNRIGRRAEPEDMPAQEGMRRARALRGDRKQFNENLAPLRRYLEKNTGRPWNKVFSEIAAHLRVDSTVQQHVRDHLKDFVAITPRRGIAGWYTRPDGLWHQRFYVDPRTGLLCRTDRLPEEKARTRRTRPAAPVTRVSLAPDRELRRIGGIWYAIRLAPLPAPAYRASQERVLLPANADGSRGPLIAVTMTVRRLVTPPVWDAARNTWVQAGPATDDPAARSAWNRSRPGGRYAIAKQALSHRELRRHGLTNAPESKA